MDTFRVMRQDDNGNRFLVAQGLGRAEAERRAAEFEARGHKQLYWVEQAAPEADAVAVGAPTADAPTAGPEDTGPAAPAGVNRIVVGGAILHRGRVLAARRSAPAAVAGRWEFPGGKAEPGETEEQALERELMEELGVRARAVERLPGAWLVRPGLELHIWVAGLLAGEPRPLEDHDELRWLGPEELAGLDWLEHDRAVLPHVARLLAGAPAAS
ncbi:(deoxy)nucleoside triphosphate pyrophosphohydrolase [Kitasatospora sp. NBC_01560]|uniref:(deoxy)nucleoside triphosphate pyrophosphohydrolase n=1 Tax=Kitasatospora sp. NBC_01560 TaxID=2975965 RepID=UPI0038648C84